MLTGLLELVGVLRIHAARNFKQHSFFEFRWFNIHIQACVRDYGFSLQKAERRSNAAKFHVCYDSGESVGLDAAPSLAV